MLAPELVAKLEYEFGKDALVLAANYVQHSFRTVSAQDVVEELGRQQANAEIQARAAELLDEEAGEADGDAETVAADPRKKRGRKPAKTEAV